MRTTDVTQPLSEKCPLHCAYTLSMIAYNYQTKGSRKPILPSSGSNWILAALPQRSMIHRARHSTHFGMFLKLQCSLPAIPLRSLRLFLTAAQSHINFWKALCTYSLCLPQHLCCRSRQLGLGTKIKPTRHHHHGRQHLDPMSLREMPASYPCNTRMISHEPIFISNLVKCQQLTTSQSLAIAACMCPSFSSLPFTLRQQPHCTNTHTHRH